MAGVVSAMRMTTSPHTPSLWSSAATSTQLGADRVLSTEDSPWHGRLDRSASEFEMETLVDGRHHPGELEEVSGTVSQLRTAPEEEYEGVLVPKECFAVYSVLRDRYAVRHHAVQDVRPLPTRAAC